MTKIDNRDLEDMECGKIDLFDVNPEKVICAKEVPNADALFEFSTLGKNHNLG